MFSKEKDQFKKYRQTFDDIRIPDELDDHIQAGFMKAKQEAKRKLPFKWLLSVALVAIVLVGFASTKYIIDLINDNKGLVDAIKHDYYMKIGASEKIKDVEFVVDGVIADEYGMVLFYTIHSDVKDSKLNLEYFQINDGRHDQFLSYGGDEKGRNKGRAFSGKIENFYQSPIKVNEFKLEANVRGRVPDTRKGYFFDEEFIVTFTLPDEILTGKTYELNETVTIEGQKMTFTKAVVSPLRAEVHVKMDPRNTKKILSFDGLQFVDEAGETWGQILNGLTATYPSEDEHIIYLQSNYFSEPEKLYLAISKIQAIDKGDEFVIVDPVKEEIIHQPAGNALLDVRVDKRHLVFTPKKSLFENYYPLGFRTVYNETGDVYESFTTYVGNNEIGIGLDNLDSETGLLSLEIFLYPSWITGDEKIRIK